MRAWRYLASGAAVFVSGGASTPVAIPVPFPAESSPLVSVAGVEGSRAGLSEVLLHALARPSNDKAVRVLTFDISIS